MRHAFTLYLLIHGWSTNLILIRKYPPNGIPLHKYPIDTQDANTFTLKSDTFYRDIENP